MNVEILSQFKKWCNKGERCRADFKARAQKFGLTTEVSDGILAILESEGWINEQRYAKAFVHDKSAIAKWPENRIRLMLKARGIPPVYVQQAIEEEYILDEASELKRWIVIKLKSYKHNDTKKRYAALYRFLLGKGFTGEKVSEALRCYREEFDSI